MLSRILLFALLLIAGRNDTKNFPCLFFALRGLNVWPRKSKLSTGFSFRLSSSLQYTIRVFSGCSSSLHWAKRFSIACRISFACSSVLQCTSASSAYLSNDTSGWFFLIHSSNAWCLNIFARSGLHTPPCGVPLCRFSRVPSVLCIGAFSHRSIYRRTHLHSVCFFTARITSSWSRLSKNPLMSRSITQSLFQHLCRAVATASSADFPGRNP